MQLQTRTATGKQGTLTVSEAVFGGPVNKTLLTQAIRVYMANERQGTSKVKTRAEVNLTKKKVYKQKGTGGARHAAKSAPIFVGGGVTHGPTGNQNWSLSLPQKQKHQALISALSWQNQAIQVVDGIETADGKTKEVAKMIIDAAPEARSIMLVIPTNSEEIRRSCRNIKNVIIIQAHELTALDVVRANSIIMTTATVKFLEKKLEVLAKKTAENALKPKPVAPKKKPKPKVKGKKAGPKKTAQK